MPTDLSWMSALVLLAAAILLRLGWHLADDAHAFLSARLGRWWGWIVIVIVIVVIVIIIIIF